MPLYFTSGVYLFRYPKVYLQVGSRPPTTWFTIPTLQQSKLIVWDECTMAHNQSLEALAWSLQDLRENFKTFGSTLILFAGDFGQTLPVIPRSTPADEMNACLNSNLWADAKTLKLTKNMRVRLQNDYSSEIFQISYSQLETESSRLSQFQDVYNYLLNSVI